MHIRIRHFGVAIALALVGCSGDDNSVPAAASGTVTCGAGTVLQNSVCVVQLPGDAGPGTDAGASDGGASDASVVTCGPGTVLRGSSCVLPPAASITKARLTYLSVLHDMTQPAYLNNPIPIRFGITSNSPDPTHPVTTPVTVVFSFVESAPADPTKPGICSSNGMVLDLVGNGTEQKFEGKIFPTGDCTFVKASTKVDVSVGFDEGLKQSGVVTTIDYPAVVFSAAKAAAADNQLCRTSGAAGGANTGAGCVFPLALAPTPLGPDGKPLVNVTFDSLTPASSVAVLPSSKEDPEVPAGKHESDEPAIVVDAKFALNGRDPYQVPVDPSKLPADYVAAHPTILNDLKFGLDDAGLAALDDLPTAGGAAPAFVRYDIVPTNKLAPSAWLPLMIDDPNNPNPDGHVAELDLTELEPGTENGFTHALFIEGDALAAVTTGPWANDSAFTVRGCLIANFTEGGEPTDVDPSDNPAGGDVPKGDCHTFAVQLVKAPTPTTGASAQSFDMTWSRTVGDPNVIALIGSLSTTNSLDLSGAKSDTQLSVDIKGNIGSPFGVNLVSAHAKGGAVTALAKSYVDVGVDAFGVNIFGFQNSVSNPSYTNTFGIAKQFTFPVLSYGFGLVSVGITAGVGGNLGLNTVLNVNAQTGGDSSTPALANAVASGLVTGTVTPSAGLTGSATGGIDVLVASATVTATLQVVEIGTPVNATLRWGVTQGTADQVTQMTVLGNLTWDLTITWLNASIDLAGSIGICPFFCSSSSVNLFKYQNSTETINLLNRSLTEPLVLQ